MRVQAPTWTLLRFIRGAELTATCPAARILGQLPDDDCVVPWAPAIPVKMVLTGADGDTIHVDLPTSPAALTLCEACWQSRSSASAAGAAQVVEQRALADTFGNHYARASMANTALITGANRGIGQEVARMLATQGWDVLVGARDHNKGEAAAAQLRKDTGGRLKALELDVTSDTSVASAARKLRDSAILIDALVNNAGVYVAARDPNRAAVTLETNWFGPLRVTLAMLPLLRDGASITNVTSGLGALANLDDEHRRLFTDPALTRDALAAHIQQLVHARGRTWDIDPYGVSKAALNALTRILAAELVGRNIRVNATDPGLVRTDMGGRTAPRSVEQGAASVLFGVTTTETGGIFRDGQRIAL
jgi:NAD(P)-dependent dehydrogenase (short-subunit alcohol dehydrogenase family)